MSDIDISDMVIDLMGAALPESTDTVPAPEPEPESIDATESDLPAETAHRIQEIARPDTERRTAAAEAGRQRLFDEHEISVSRSDPLYSEAVFLGAAVDVMVQEIQDKLSASLQTADGMLARAEDAATAATALASKAIHNVSSEAAEDASNQIAEAAEALASARNELVTTANAVFAGTRKIDEYIKRRQEEHAQAIGDAATKALQEYLESLDKISIAAAHEAIKTAMERRASESFGHRVAVSITDFYAAFLGPRLAPAGFWATAAVVIGLSVWAIFR